MSVVQVESDLEVQDWMNDRPRFETFRFRAVRMKGDLRLCMRCLQHRRCHDGRGYGGTRSWKQHRRTRYRPTL